MALTPTLAFAQCPAGAELATGISVFERGGAVDTYTADGANVVESQYRFEPGEGARSLLARGIYLVMSQDVENNALVPGSRTTFTYPTSPANMPLPTPGGTWTAQVATLDSDGLITETHVMTFGDETQLTMGSCGYRMIPVEVRYGEDDGELLYYLPDLGFALLAGVGVGANREMYQFSDIRKATP